VARRKLDWVTRRGKDGFNLQAAKLDADLAAAIAELDEALDVVLTVNEPSVQPQDFTSSLLKITARSWEDHRGQRRTVLTPEEASILAITKGSLTEIERREIQQHVVHTFQFLAQIPWTREFRRIPEIARSHHEKLDGSGYPFGFRGDQIPLQSRMMTIADIYDALTATDRPYKKACASKKRWTPSVKSSAPARSTARCSTSSSKPASSRTRTFTKPRRGASPPARVSNARPGQATATTRRRARGTGMCAYPRVVAVADVRRRRGGEEGPRPWRRRGRRRRG
jgi:hypothetical protein